MLGDIDLANRDSVPAHQTTSMIALITPVSGLVKASKSFRTPSKLVRWVIHGSVRMVPDSIKPMIRRKSGGNAFREARIEAYGLDYVLEGERVQEEREMAERAEAVAQDQAKRFYEFTKQKFPDYYR